MFSIFCVRISNPPHGPSAKFLVENSKYCYCRITLCGYNLWKKKCNVHSFTWNFQNIFLNLRFYGMYTIKLKILKYKALLKMDPSGLFKNCGYGISVLLGLLSIVRSLQIVTILNILTTGWHIKVCVNIQQYILIIT